MEGSFLVSITVDNLSIGYQIGQSVGYIDYLIRNYPLKYWPLTNSEEYGFVIMCLCAPVHLSL